MAEQYLVAALGDAHMAFDLSYVSEIVKGAGAMPVPGAAAAIGGLAYLRGRILPVIDLAACLGIKHPVCSLENRGMNVIVAHNRTLYSFQVDAVYDTVLIEADDMQPMPPHLGAAWQRFGCGVYQRKKDILVVFDIPALLNSLCSARQT